MTEQTEGTRSPTETGLAIEHERCSKCMVRPGMRCKSKSGVEYPPSTVHGPRLKSWRESHGLAAPMPDAEGAVFVGAASDIELMTDNAIRYRSQLIKTVHGGLYLVRMLLGDEEFMRRVSEVMVDSGAAEVIMSWPEPKPQPR